MNPNYYGEYQESLSNWLRQYNKKTILNQHEAISDFTIFPQEPKNIPKKYLKTFKLLSNLLDVIIHLKLAPHPKGGTFITIVAYGYSGDINNYARLIKRIMDIEKPYKTFMKRDFLNWKNRMTYKSPHLTNSFPDVRVYLEELILLEVESINQHINNLLDKKKQLPNYITSKKKHTIIKGTILEARVKTLKATLSNYTYLNSNNYGYLKPYFRKS